MALDRGKVTNQEEEEGAATGVEVFPFFINPVAPSSISPLGALQQRMHLTVTTGSVNL